MGGGGQVIQRGGDQEGSDGSDGVQEGEEEGKEGGWGDVLACRMKRLARKL